MNILNKNIRYITKKSSGFLVSMLFFIFSTPIYTNAQNIGISDSGSTPSKYAVLDLSTATRRGFLPPTLTTSEMNAITPPNGTIIYNTTVNCLETYYSGHGWQSIICPCSGPPTAPSISGASSVATGTTGVSLTASGATGASSYSWSVPAGLYSAGTLTGTTTSSIAFTAGAVAGPYTVTCTAINNCGSATSSNFVITLTATCAGVISVDANSQASKDNNVVTITTTHTNEIVLVTVDGISTSGQSFGGSVSISGGSSSGLTQLVNTSAYIGQGIDYAENAAVYAFVASTVATYTITVTETHMNYYNNSAISLYGFCSTATVAGNILTGTAATFVYGGSQASTLSASITPTVANSYIVSNYANWIYNGQGTMTWPNPAGNSVIASTYNSTGAQDNSYDGYADAGSGSAITFKIQDLNGGSGNIAVAVLQLIDVHN